MFVCLTGRSLNWSSPACTSNHVPCTWNWNTTRQVKSRSWDGSWHVSTCSSKDWRWAKSNCLSFFLSTFLTKTSQASFKWSSKLWTTSEALQQLSHEYALNWISCSKIPFWICTWWKQNDIPPLIATIVLLYLLLAKALWMGSKCSEVSLGNWPKSFIRWSAFKSEDIPWMSCSEAMWAKALFTRSVHRDFIKYFSSPSWNNHATRNQYTQTYSIMQTKILPLNYV